MPLPSVLITHPRERLATYFGEQALTYLQGSARVKLNSDAHDWSTAELMDAAQGCEVLIAMKPLQHAITVPIPWISLKLASSVDGDLTAFTRAARPRKGV